MAKPYSQDLRNRVIASVAGGRSRRATATLFAVSIASVVKWAQHWRATGTATTKRMGGWLPAVAARRAGVVIGADRREAGTDPAGGGGRTGRTREAGKLRRGVAVLEARRDQC